MLAAKGLGFVKQAFLKLQGLSHLDLRMGMRFQGVQAAALHQALKDAAANIRAMPVKYMTYPNGGPILEVMKTGRQYRPGMVLLSEEYLSGFGEMRIPLDLWQTLRKHTIWVEPAVISEWSEDDSRICEGPGEGTGGIPDQASHGLGGAGP